MDEHSQSPEQFMERLRAAMNEAASAGESYILPIPNSTDDVQMENFDASNADEKLDASEEDTHAEQVVVKECRLCKHKRLAEDEQPRKVRRLPTEVTQHALFQKKSMAVQLCPECDGQAVELALRQHKERLANV